VIHCIRVALALVTGIVFGDGAENVIHLALGASFLLLAFAVFDFRLPTWINWVASAATGALAVIFLLQVASDLAHSASLQHLAYAVLGSAWRRCWAMHFFSGAWHCSSNSAGRTKILGVVVLVTIFFIEIYNIVTAYVGGDAPGVLKLFYLPLFIWLLLEGIEQRSRILKARP
jgi:hypothetical protein